VSASSQPGGQDRVRLGRPPGDRSGTRERILRAAVEVFAEKGYHGTGINHLCERAGLRAGGLYHHIGSKEQLLYDVISAHALDVLRGDEEIVSSDDPPETKLRRLILHQTRIVAERSEEVRVSQHDADALTGERAAELRRVRVRVEQIWLQVLREGVASGAFRACDGITARGAQGAVNFMYMWYRPDGQLSPQEIGERFVEFVLAGVRA
jgi:AcrR family transcriptional regulator